MNKVSFKTKIINLITAKPVCVIAMGIAFVTMFFVAPDKKYWGYINWETLVQLFCLMATVKGFEEIGVFDRFGKVIIRNSRSVRELVSGLLMITFFSGMLVTNDVALLTFVPLSIWVLERLKLNNLLIPTVALQTIAANAGSMLMPTGNPHNLFVYSNFDLTPKQFYASILPFGILAFFFILVAGLLFKGTKITAPEEDGAKTSLPKARLIAYLVMFILSLLSVFSVINYLVVLVLCVIIMLIFDRKLIAKVDWSLLLTFLAFFIMVGNLGRIDLIRDSLSRITEGHEFPVGILLSQVISNLPATVLLSGFTPNREAIMVATDIGGMGTLIASLASLISFNFYTETKGHKKGKYMLIYGLFGIAFIAVQFLLAIILHPENI